MVIYAGRSINGIPRQAREHAASPILRVDGLVAEPRFLKPADFEQLPHVPFLDTLSNNETGNIPQTAWSGVRLSDLLATVTFDPTAKFVRVSGGPYGCPVLLAEADHALLCDRLDDKPLTVDRGGPWCLVVAGTLYFTSVKWVDRIELTAEEPDDSATRIARARARARDSKK
jgi:DMSO/TMAO reductase YedYZ molybdopterin-dependent catalytic subunit